MKLINNNPYRIVGILSNASAREILSRKGKITAYSKVGKEISSEYDFTILSSLQRNVAIIDKAFSDIEQSQNKVFYSLFWFLNINSIDNTALQYLISGNVEKATEIWEKFTTDKEINSKNFSAFNNLSTLCLLAQSKESLRCGITIKINLIESKCFHDFVHTVADETFTIDTNKQVELLVDELVKQFKGDYSIAEIMDLFSECNEDTHKLLSKKFSEEPIHRIEILIEQCAKKRENDKINANKYGTDLLRHTDQELKLLKSIVGDSLQYKMLADNVAKEILQCSIDYFNESQELDLDNNYIEESIKLATLTQKLAVNDATKNRIKENIITLEKMKDRELTQAIEVLKSIKEAYDKACKEIDLQVVIMKSKLSYNQSINYSKVEQMKQNALDWKKVINLIKETIPPENVEKIKLINDPAAITEFKSLMDFLFKRLNFSQTNQIRYIYYWKTENTRSKMIFTIKSLPTWMKWCLAIAIILILVGIVGGEEALVAVFQFMMLIAIIGFIGWLKSR